MARSRRLDRGYVTLVTTLLSMLTLLAVTSAQQGEPRQRPALVSAHRGVYTTEQAARGKEEYERYCFRCHKRDLSGEDKSTTNSAPPLAGGRFLFHWENGPLTKLFTKMQVEMPPVYSEVLSDEVKIDILAYLLKSNGFPSGAVELTKDKSLLDSIVLTRNKDAAVGFSVRNFSLVRSVGCLSSNTGHEWTLTHAAPPAIVGEPGTEPNSRQAVQSASGTDTYTLVSVNAFKPDTLIGHKVEARGLIYESSEDKLIHVTSLESLAATCPNQ